MDSTVIKVDNVAKLYQLGTVGSWSFSDDVKKWWASVRGKEDPFAKLAEVNDRASKGNSDYVWALQDVSFEVKQGEVLGIIGRNGAGKSTLLKILSRTTLPSKGEISVKGRIASLLEVGTGFHPELSGRENIFLNGAILGMTKAEIRKKFDEIIDFSGVERYIDTPVKRYSSGMYVRLAFAVAAHLEPEILIVDEVLAVGDAEFQKKCMGKMKDVSGHGRTVIFVSHNMPSIRALCTSVALMEKGRLTRIGEPASIISQYLNSDVALQNTGDGLIHDSIPKFSNGETKFRKLQTLNRKMQFVNEFYFKEKITLKIGLQVNKHLENVTLNVFVVNSYGETILMAQDNDRYLPSVLEAGMHEISIGLEEFLMPGDYSIGLLIAHFHTGSTIEYIESFGNFKVHKQTENGEMEYPWATIHGYTVPRTNWTRTIIKQ
jgi:lipopolysaccharide transport system ATP-binding protein